MFSIHIFIPETTILLEICIVKSFTSIVRGTCEVACVIECDWLDKYGNYHCSCIRCQRICNHTTRERHAANIA